MSPYFQSRLQRLSKFDIVGDVRGQGLLGCIEGRPINSQNGSILSADRRLGTMLDEACEKMGLLVRPLINMAVFSPPLIITKNQVDEMFDIIEKAIEQVTVYYQKEGL